MAKKPEYHTLNFPCFGNLPTVEHDFVYVDQLERLVALLRNKGIHEIYGFPYFACSKGHRENGVSTCQISVKISHASADRLGLAR